MKKVPVKVQLRAPSGNPAKWGGPKRMRCKHCNKKLFGFNHQAHQQTCMGEPVTRQIAESSMSPSILARFIESVTDTKRSNTSVPQLIAQQ